MSAWGKPGDADAMQAIGCWFGECVGVVQAWQDGAHCPVIIH